MLKNRQTVVCMPKASSNARNAAQGRMQSLCFAIAPPTYKPLLAMRFNRIFIRIAYAMTGICNGLASSFFGSYSRIVLLLWMMLALAVAPDMALAASGRINVESGGINRTAILVEHARLKKTRRPVIIILHSGGGNAVRVRHTLGLEDRARSASPVMVYPEAIGSHWSDAANADDSRDMVFIHDLVAKLISEGIADRHRIFIVGISSGGILALKLACGGGQDFAGIVPIFADLPSELAASCKPSRPVPFLLILGTADPFVPYSGGAASLIDSKAELLSGNATLDVFAKAAACSDGHTTVTFADHDARDNSRVYLDKLNGCKVPVELLRVEGGGHLLPRTGMLAPGARAPDGERGAPPPGMRNRDVDAPLLIWDFLRRLGA
jgi:polyhydroxybutyrate depolymerase